MKRQMSWCDAAHQMVWRASRCFWPVRVGLRSGGERKIIEQRGVAVVRLGCIVTAEALRRVRKTSEGEVEGGGERGGGGGEGADPEEGFRAGEPNEGARVGSEHEGEEGAVGEGGRGLASVREELGKLVEIGLDGPGEGGAVEE